MYSIPRAASSSRKRCETSGVTGTGADIGAMTRISRLLPDSPLDELVVEEERALERRRRALVRLAEDADQDRPAGERGQRVAHPLGPGDRVVLEAALGEARRRVHVVLGAERDDEDVGVVRASVGRDVPARPGRSR